MKSRRRASPASASRLASTTLGPTGPAAERSGPMERHIRRQSARFVAALLVLLAALPAWADCPLDLGRGTGLVVFSDHYMVAFRPDPIRIEVGEPFALLFNVCTKSNNAAELVAID